MNSPVNQYYALPVEGEGEPVNGDPRGPGKWATLAWPDIIEGYQISDLGQIISPNGNPLKAALNGKQMYVTVRTAHGSGKGLRIDKMVLATFDRSAADDEVPIHLDGDNRNCRLDNLRYGPQPPPAYPAKRKSPTSPPAKPKVAAKPKARSKGTRPKSSADYDTIDVSRIYRHRGTGLSVTVGEDGKAKMPKINLSAAEMRAVSLLSQRIAEMNEILGLGRK